MPAAVHAASPRPEPPVRVRRVLLDDPCEPVVPLDGRRIACLRHPVHQDPFHRVDGCEVVPSVLCALCESRVNLLRRWVTKGYADPCSRCGEITRLLGAAARAMGDVPAPAERTRALSATVSGEIARRRARFVDELVRAGGEPFVLSTVLVGRAPFAPVTERFRLLDPTTRYLTLDRWRELVPETPGALAARVRACVEAHVWTWESVALRAMPDDWFVDLVAAVEAEP